MVVRAHDLKVNTFCKTEENIKQFNIQAVNFQHLKKQEKFLATPMGKGILLLSLSLIKYRFVVTLNTSSGSDGINVSSYLRLHISAGTP